MMTESKLTLTQSCELLALFEHIDFESLECYARDLKQRMNQCAISYIEGGPFIEQQTYLEMQEIYSRVESALINKQINVM
jgi:hypothetical protein